MTRLTVYYSANAQKYDLTHHHPGIQTVMSNSNYNNVNFANLMPLCFLLIDMHHFSAIYHIKYAKN